MNSTTHSAGQRAPIGILVYSLYRNHSGDSTEYVHRLSNNQQLSENTINAAFTYIGDEEVLMHRYGLPNDAPVDHPEEPCNDDDTCYMEIADVIYLHSEADLKAAQYANIPMHDTDIALVVDATTNADKCTEDWATLSKAILEENIDNAKEVLDEAGYAVVNKTCLADMKSRMIPNGIDRAVLLTVAGVALSNDKLVRFLNEECGVTTEESHALKARIETIFA